MVKEEVKGTIVEVSLREILSAMLSDYVSNLKRNGEKIFVSGDEFSSTIDFNGYMRQISEVFTDDNIRISISRDKLKEYISDLETIGIAGPEEQDINRKREAVNYCIKILKRNLL